MKKIELACIIEDDPLHLLITKKYIELSGFVDDVLVYKNGKEAFKTLKDRSIKGERLPQVIFLDLNMPVWDGWQFLDEFTRSNIEEQVTICILTSSNNEEDIKRAERYSSINNYLIKPIGLDELIEVFDELVNN